MARETISVKPELIIWAREKAGYSQDKAALQFNKIGEWESGASAPTYKQLEKLAEAFKVPVVILLFPSPPETPPINKTFRTLPQDALAQIPQKVRQLLNKAKAFQINLHELCNKRNPSERLITHSLKFSTNDSTTSFVNTVREFIGISLEDQTSWSNADEAFKKWREALLSVGIFVFKDAFHEDGYSGFCLYDSIFPIIYVNNSTTKTRQIFTLFHELAHLLFHTSGIDRLDDDFLNPADQAYETEILCNKFSAEFLLPERILEDVIANEQTAETLAEQYHVSRESVFRRFLNKGLITQQIYSETANKWTGQKKSRKGKGGNHYLTKIAYLGGGYMQLALSQYHQSKISQSQLAEYLDTKPKNVGNLEEHYARGQV